MKINDKKKLLKYISLYRSFIFKFVKFETDSKDIEVIKLIELLNIKNKYKRIYKTINDTCDYIDSYYKNKNICSFKNNCCICHRKQHLEYKNGCCRKCFHQSSKGCTTKNIACKMFYCSHIKESNIKVLTYKDLVLLNVLNPIQLLILKSDYFRTIEEVSKDLCLGYCIATIRMEYAAIKRNIYYRREDNVIRYNKKSE